MKTVNHRTPWSACPHCGVAHDMATAKGERGPRAGDVSICFDCAGLSVFTATLRRLPWPEGLPIPAEIERAQMLARRKILS